MGRVFLSYAREDANVAERLAEAIASAGYEVWWDRHIHGGSRFASEIDRALSEADAVVVLWSRTACESAWVPDEAAEGRDSGRLIPVMLDSTRQPLGFRQFQAVDLSAWKDGGGSDRLGELLKAIARLAGEAAPAPGTSQSAPRKRSICVLPFANMSGEPEQEYFSDGISEDITTDLSKISALSVTARNTAFTFKGSAVDIPTIAHKLGVSHVLEGSVRKAGDRVRITAQLIDGASGDHVWAERYDRDLTDIFAVQDEISQAIVEALKVRLLPEEKKAIENRGTQSAEAYDLYLMARQYWIAGNHGDRRREERVIRIATRATEIDPNYARAWALIALAQSNLRYGFGQPGDGGVAAAQRALSLDPSIAEAHCVLARHHLERGNVEAANAELEIALRLSPDSWEVNKEAARLCMAQRRIEDAQGHYEKAASIMETDFHAWGMLTTCYDALGNDAAKKRAAEMALKQAERVLAEDPSNGAALGISASALVVLGQRDKAKDRIERALLIDPDNLNMRYNFACALAQDHDSDAALDMVGPVFERGSLAVVKLMERDPDFDSIREDARFRKMLADAKHRLGMESAA